MTVTTDATSPARRKRAPFELPAGFPQPHALGSTDLFIGVLGIGASTFARYLAEGRLPVPVKIGKLNRWPQEVIARIAAEGVPSA